MYNVIYELKHIVYSNTSHLSFIRTYVFKKEFEKKLAYYENWTWDLKGWTLKVRDPKGAGPQKLGTLKVRDPKSGKLKLVFFIRMINSFCQNYEKMLLK